ncbi:MAG: sigma-70 family RNA polymerase sigma factor [Tannerellaceae bacterium]|nr:sigma-70 family RNA polymerase sigma factor [Tannerellaceae bacterium]MCD8264307.1 sigma-70 family RNA polymerase sigma factor [Tannerellaceae bacterium]
MNKSPGTTELTGTLNLTDVFKKYQAQLRGYIKKRIPSNEDVEDILQNVFYQLVKANNNADPIKQLSAWLYSVTRNQIIDKSRKHTEDSLPYFLSEDEEAFTFADFFDEGASPEDEYIRSLVWEELESALQELPPEQRSVFELTELEGFSFKEIAESTGITVNTLISRKRYAVLHLRERLKNLYDEIRME